MNSGQIALPRPQNAEPQLDLESGRTQALPTPTAAPPLPVNGEAENKAAAADLTLKRRRDSNGAGAGNGKNGTHGQARPDLPPPPPPQRQRRDEGLTQVQEEEGFESRQSHINYELRDTPGLGEDFVDCLLSFCCCCKVCIFQARKF